MQSGSNIMGNVPENDRNIYVCIYINMCVYIYKYVYIYIKLTFNY